MLVVRRILCSALKYLHLANVEMYIFYALSGGQDTVYIQVLDE